MQRLFSMFPMGRPGIALLFLRTALGVMLMDGVVGPLAKQTEFSVAVLGTWIVAIALCAGLFTPVASVLCVALELVAWRMGGGPLETLHVCAILIALALALLGPGGYSLDARFFGRRQVFFRSGDWDGK